MASCIDIKLEDKCNDDGEITISDFAILGYEITKDDSLVNLFFYFTSDDNKDYLLRTSYHIEGELDKKFFYASMHKKINMNIMDKEDRDIIMEYVKNIPNNNSYYCSFNAIEINNDYSSIKCIATNHTSNSNIQNQLTLNIPLSIFLRLRIIKNRFLFNIPIDVSIDDDSRFNEINIHNNCILNYIGCSVMSSVIAEYFSLSIEDNKKIGLISCVPSLDGKIIKSNTITKEQFGALYKQILAISLSDIVILKDNLCLYCIHEKSVSLYILTEDAKECKLLKPYELIY